MNSEQILDKYKVNYLYHITHKDNISNILKYGLLSHKNAHSKKLISIDISNQQVNSRRSKFENIYNREIHDYVPLYFNPKNPMLYVRQNMQNDLIILAIDRKIMFQPNVIFSDGNAASSNTRFYRDLKDLDKLGWFCINDEYWTRYQDGKRVKCSEVLVYSQLEIKFIKKINCFNAITRDFIIQHLKNYSQILTEVSSYLFFNNVSSSLIIDDTDDLPF